MFVHLCTHIARNFGSSHKAPPCVQSPIQGKYRMRTSCGPFKAPQSLQKKGGTVNVV